MNISKVKNLPYIKIYNYFRAKDLAYTLLRRATSTEDKQRANQLCRRALKIDGGYNFDSRSFVEMVVGCASKGLESALLYQNQSTRLFK